jgi:hypothetical protein
VPHRTGMALLIPGLHGAHLRTELIQSLGRRRVTNAIATKELTPLWCGVLVESNRMLDPWTRAAAALLTAGPRALVAGVTAAYLHGCRATESTSTHILVPYGCETRSRDGLVVHRGRAFAEDAVELDGVRVLPLDRVIADLLCTLPARDALAVADEALGLAADTSDVFRKQIGSRIERRHDPRGTVRAAGLLDLTSAAVDSPAESWIRLMIIEQGLPLPEVNWPIRDLDGRLLYRLDLAWPHLRVALEYDGYAAHAGREADDQARRADLEARGWIVVVVRKEDLRAFTKVVTALRAAFARRGYMW